MATQIGLLYFCQKYKDILYGGVKQVYLKWYFLVGLALAGAIVFHPGQKGKFFFTLQMFVSFTMFLEAMALIPQLIHIRQSNDTEGLNTIYLYCLGLARIGRVFFWYTMSSKVETFWYMLVADVLHTVVLVLFFLAFKKARKSNTEVLTGKNTFD